MSRDEAYKAVLAFLDQFISRGAAKDVVNLRERLRRDPVTRQLLEDQIKSDDPSEREAFDAMTEFFAAELERAGGAAHDSDGPDLVELISWTSWGWGSPSDPESQATSDPAQWHDWLASVAAAQGC